MSGSATVNVRRWFDVHGESFALVGIVGVFFVFCFLRFHGFFVFQVGKNTCSVLGTLVQSLASVFAIVFSISLVAVQFCSEQLSYRLMRLYVWNLNFVVPFVMNALALLFNLFLLSYICYYGLMDFGLLLGFMAVVSLIPFFVYTFRFMVPVHVVGVLLDRVKTNPMLLSENFAERILYRENFQPVEDIISSCVRKGDYAMAQDSIERVREKMYAVLNVVKKRIGKESESSSIRLIVS